MIMFQKLNLVILSSNLCNDVISCSLSPLAGGGAAVGGGGIGEGYGLHCLMEHSLSCSLDPLASGGAVVGGVGRGGFWSTLFYRTLPFFRKGGGGGG